jgi:hypothetical protein
MWSTRCSVGVGSPARKVTPPRTSMASGEQLDAQAAFERLRGGPALDASAGG